MKYVTMLTIVVVGAVNGGCSTPSPAGNTESVFSGQALETTATPTTTENVGATSTFAEYDAELIAACEPGAASYSGEVIAAFQSPTLEGGVVCWVDGHVAKSPPPDIDADFQPDFDRLTFLATLDGTFVRFVAAGYRDQMDVQPPAP